MMTFEKIWEILSDFNIISVIVRLILATIFGGFIGMERGKHGRPAGLRTHILVCVGASLTALSGLFLSQEMGLASDVARLSAQVISGIGFLGAGMIMVRNGSIITGLTTAAGMWATAAIGIAVGYGFYVGTVVAVVLSLFSMTILSRLESTQKNAAYVYVELPDLTLADQVADILRNFEDSMNSFDIFHPKSGIPGHVGMSILIKNDHHFKQLKQTLLELDERILVLYDINS